MAPTKPGRTARASAIALWILAVVAALFFLRAASSLLIPIVIGVLISYALEPVVRWLSCHRVPRPLGTSLVMLTLLGLLGWGVYALRDEVTRTIDALPEAARKAREMVTAGPQSGAGASLQRAAEELQGGSPEKAQGGSGSGGSDRNAGVGAPQPSGSSVGDGLQSLIQRGVSSLVALAGNIMVVVFLVFFLLLSGSHVKKRLVEIAGRDDERRRTTEQILEEIDGQIQRFLLVRLVTAVIVGAATWMVLAWMGVQGAAVWGILAGVFNSIPYFGPVIVSGGLLAIGLVQGGGMSQALQMSGAALVITSLEGWLLTPPLMGKAERMSALAVFLGLLLWTWVWGAWGTILAVPMLVVLKAVADHVDSLKPIGRLMAP